MATNATFWDGGYIGPGPIAILVSAPNASEGDDNTLRMEVGTASSCDAIGLDAERLGEFLFLHAGELFVSVDAANLHYQLYRHLSARNDSVALYALWCLSRESRWVDIRLLAREIQFARSDGEEWFRDVDQLLSKLSQGKTSGQQQCPQGTGEPDCLSGHGEEIKGVLDVFERCRSESELIVADAQAVGSPKYKIPEPSRDKAEELRRESSKFYTALSKRRAKSGQEASSRDSSDPDRTCSPNDLGEESTPESTNPSDPLGIGVVVRGAIALGGLAKSECGFWVARNRLQELNEKAEELYRLASAIIFRHPAARECFSWDRDVVERTPERFPIFDSLRLGNWLRTAAEDLCDLQKQPAHIPRGADGRLTQDAEHWGIWPGCNRVLSAWRQLFRMAEVQRIQQAGEYVHPQYEIHPVLRSLEPNLEAYRGLGVPVFHPRPHHVFITGRLMEVRARCLASVSVRRGYVSSGYARLHNFVLLEPNALDVAAEELYVAYRCAHAQSDSEADAAVADFDRWRSADSDDYYAWLWLTDALLESTPLGLPGANLRTLLQLDYNLESLDERTVLELQALLSNWVAYELGPFLEDNTIDLVAARSEMTANAALRRFVHRKHPETAGAALRNRLRGQSNLSIAMPSGRVNDDDQGKQSLAVRQPPSWSELVEFRALTLGGRATFRASQSAVRQQEVLRAAEEIMMEVCYDLLAAGYRLLGIAGNEFVIELPRKAAPDAMERVGEVAGEAAGRALGDLPGRVVLSQTDEW